MKLPSIFRLPKLLFVALVLALVIAHDAAAQIAPPTGPVTFCGTQEAGSLPVIGYEFQTGTVTSPVGVEPPAVTWSAAPASITLVAPVPQAPPGVTNCFALPAALLPIGRHAVRIHSVASSASASVVGPTYLVTVGIAGRFVITAIIPPGE